MHTRIVHPSILPGLCCALILAAPLLRAEEGGSGHYFPGSMASFMDGVSPVESFVLRLNALDYSGSVGASREIPIGGLTVLDAAVESSAVGLSVFWRPRWGSIGDKWSFAMSATIPFVDLTVDGQVTSGPVVVGRSDSSSGLGDLVLMPVMLNYAANPDLNINLRLGLYAPTGSYETGRLANTGKNFWTVEPTVGLMYFGLQNGREASLFFGADFNQENPDTDYKSGAQVHFDGTLAQHFPLAGGLAGAGITGFWYRQVSGDSGAGATLGDFKAESNGVGPVISYMRKTGDADLLLELKWLNEFGVTNRPSGDSWFLKMMYVRK